MKGQGEGTSVPARIETGAGVRSDDSRSGILFLCLMSLWCCWLTAILGEPWKNKIIARAGRELLACGNMLSWQPKQWRVSKHASVFMQITEAVCGWQWVEERSRWYSSSPVLHAPPADQNLLSTICRQLFRSDSVADHMF